MSAEFGADGEAKLLECQQAREKALCTHVGKVCSLTHTHTHTHTRKHKLKDTLMHI